MIVRALGWSLSALLLGVAVVALRSQTISVHEPVVPGSQLLVVIDADTRAGESGQSLHELASAQVLSCRLEVRADPLGGLIEQAADDSTRFSFVLEPSLDKTDRRQFKGCIEDWRIDHLRLRVLTMVEMAP